MKKMIAYSLVGILIGAILGVGLSSLSHYFGPEKKTPSLPIPKDSHQKPPPEKIEKIKKFKGGRIITSPGQENYPAPEEGKKKLPTVEDFRKIEKMEENFIGELVDAFDRMVAKKDGSLINPTMAVFVRRAPTAMCRLEALKCWKKLESLSQSWPLPQTKKSEDLKKKASSKKESPPEKK